MDRDKRNELARLHARRREVMQQLRKWGNHPQQAKYVAKREKLSRELGQIDTKLRRLGEGPDYTQPHHG